MTNTESVCSWVVTILLNWKRTAPALARTLAAAAAFAPAGAGTGPGLASAATQITRVRRERINCFIKV